MIHKLHYPNHFRDHAKKRCEHRTREASQHYAARTCTRYAVYAVGDAKLCVQHAGTFLLEAELEAQKSKATIVDISHVDRAKLFLALYNAAEPVVPFYSETSFRKEVISYEYPMSCFEHNVHVFDFVYSCPLMVDLSKDKVATDGYDFYNGEGAFAKALATVENSNADK